MIIHSAPGYKNYKLKQLSDYKPEIIENIDVNLQSHFDDINIFNGSNYVMRTLIAHDVDFETFSVSEFSANSDNFEACLEEFEAKKLRLFLDGVILYHNGANFNLEIVARGTGYESKNI